MAKLQTDWSTASIVARREKFYAEGIGNGFPLAAVVAQRRVADALAGKFSFHAYGASPTCCAAGRAVLQVIDEACRQNLK